MFGRYIVYMYMYMYMYMYKSAFLGQFQTLVPTKFRILLGVHKMLG